MATETNNRSFKPGNHNEIALQIAEILRDIRFGSIEVVVHDGRVVQIDKRERFRLADPKAPN